MCMLSMAGLISEVQAYSQARSTQGIPNVKSMSQTLMQKTSTNINQKNIESAKAAQERADTVRANPSDPLGYIGNNVNTYA